MLQSSGIISFSDINREIGRAENTTLDLNQVRWLAGVPSGAISLSNFYGKRHEAGYNLLGWATTELQVSDRYDSGVLDKSYYNIPSDALIRARIFASTAGSDDSGSPGGYAYIRVIIIRQSDGHWFYDSTWIDRWTSGDGSGGIGNASWQFRISDLIGNQGNVTVRIIRRFITGGYRAHIWGGKHYINRICGIESDIGFY